MSAQGPLVLGLKDLGLGLDNEDWWLVAIVILVTALQLGLDLGLGLPGGLTQ